MRFLASFFLLMVFSVSATAQSIGMQFDQMPVGTTLYYKDYEGETWVERFKGKGGGHYLFEVKIDNSQTRYTKRYTPQGHLKSIVFPGGFTIQYSPFECERVLGACTYRYKGNPKYNGKYNAKLVKKGNVYQYSRARVTTEETFDTTLKLGRYNVLEEELWKAGNGKERFVRLVKMTTP